MHDLVDALAQLVDIDWKAIYNADQAKGWVHAVTAVTSRMRSPSLRATPIRKMRRLVRSPTSTGACRPSFARAWVLAGSSGDLESVRFDVRFYEEVRTWIAKLDAQERVARGEPIPDDARRLLGDIIVTSAATTGVLDIYEQAGLERPDLSALTPSWQADASQPSKAQLAIEALKASLLEESTRVTAGNEVRRKLFSERISDLMTRYTNQQLTAAEIIAELVEMAKEVVAESDRGQRFDPPLHTNELAFYDVITENEAALDVMGDDVLAQIAREIVATMQRGTRTDWTVRDDVKAKLRATIKRLLRKYGYPPDQQPAAIAEVMQQMEAFAPRYAEEA